jgi:glycosyltransferase involved in cell wall biosynthesis
MAGKRYRCLIGVEKRGLIWAGQVAARLHVPFLYFSLELYAADYLRLVKNKLIENPSGSGSFRHLRLAEARYLRKAAATIIQDRERARVLFDDHRLSMSGATIYYVPVSAKGAPVRARTRFLHDSLGLPKSAKIILYFGQIWERRYVLELARAAQSFPEDWSLVMHGDEWYGVGTKIKEIDHKGRVLLSLSMVSSEKVPELIASGDIGLAFYSPQTHNERLTAFSSEKMALYLQCGVPFVGFDYPGYRKLAKEDGCGMVIRDFSELQSAISQILVSHAAYRRHALEAFCKHYDYAKNFAKVIEGIDRL